MSEALCVFARFGRQLIVISIVMLYRRRCCSVMVMLYREQKSYRLTISRCSRAAAVPEHYDTTYRCYTAVRHATGMIVFIRDLITTDHERTRLKLNSKAPHLNTKPLGKLSFLITCTVPINDRFHLFLSMTIVHR